MIHFLSSIIRICKKQVKGKNKFQPSRKYLTRWCKILGIGVLEDHKLRDKWKKDPESGIIKTIIDDLTPCLVDRKTGEVLETAVSRFLVPETGFNKTSGWGFDWYKESIKADREVYALTLSGDKEVQGLVILIDNKKEKFINILLLEASPKNIGSNGKYIGTGGHLIAIWNTEGSSLKILG